MSRNDSSLIVMTNLSDLQRDISDLVSILSFITRRVVDLRQNDQEAEMFEEPFPLGQEHDFDETNESLDETEFEVSVSSGEKDTNQIKRNALDRLAEVLARFKTGKGTTTSDDRSRDARHVTSIIMIENMSDKSAKFLCAKNECLDGDDVEFLRTLEQLYQRIVRNGKSWK
ncbi:hypothetical protein IF1G_04337 [Cordyceps javanica]|uniref:Uncharacterized protein n=1 Tax=Cordyceps javanica TaxID=43265 RepID=A0A545V5V7_9HYPO|nr:hypothetical protein IF1G_04337 [Cordyceps javanica]